VPIAVNRGNPAVLAEARADFSKAVREMAGAIVPAEAEAGKRSRKLFGKAA
jgi:hypothetical protein